MAESDDNANKPQERFAGGIELDVSALDNPADALRQALELDDADKAVGAYRLLVAGDKSPELGLEDGIRLGDWLLAAEMYLEAARVYRQAAEQDLRHPEAPAAIFKSACLLMGPAHRHDTGADMFLYLAGNYPDFEHTRLAEQIFEHYQAGDRACIQQCLEQAGVLPGTYSPPGQAPLDETAEPVPAEAPLATHEYKYRVGRRITRLIQVPFLVCLAVFVFTLFARDRYQGVDEIHPALLTPPRQVALKEQKLIRFTRNGHHFQLKPKFDYEISGLVVGKNDYTMFGLSRGSLVYLMDLCLIWGGNVKSKVYQNPNLEIVQHGNVCYTKWKGQIRFNLSELSNNHVILSSDDLEDDFADLGEGDQIRIRGQLVDVSVQPVKDGPDSVRGTVKSSTSRSDDGMGACEIIHVTELEVLAAGTPLWRLLNRISFWLLIILALAFIARLAFYPLGLRRETLQS